MKTNAKRDAINLLGLWALGCALLVGVGHYQGQRVREARSALGRYASISPEHPEVRAAINAGNLPGARGRAEGQGSFVGTVSRVYAAKDNSVRLLNFHPDYRRAVVAAVKPEHFARLGSLEHLVGQRVVVRGRFFLYKGRPEVELSSPQQIKLVR